MKRKAYYIVNGITLYRLIAAPCLIILIFTKQIIFFKWLLAFSFFTDLIDGVLARKFKVISVFGSRLDSAADDLTVVAGLVGVLILKPAFVREQMVIIIFLFTLFIIQMIFSVAKFNKRSSFHTYGAKVAAILQGSFFILLFFLAQPVYWLLYTMAFVTAAELIEEIILVIILPEWKNNVKGLYWIKKEKKDSEKNGNI